MTVCYQLSWGLSPLHFPTTRFLPHAALIAALLQPAAAIAQAPQRLSLDDATSRAIEASHRLGEARARQQGAEATVDVFRKADVPTITALAGYTRTNHVDEFGVPQVGTGLRVIYPDIPTTTAPGWSCSGRSIPLDVATRSSARRRPKPWPAAPTSKWSASTCASKWPAPTGRW